MATYMQESQFRIVPAGTARIYRTSKQSSMYNPPVSYRKKHRTYRPCTGRTGQFRAIQAGTMRTGRYKKKKVFSIPTSTPDTGRYCPNWPVRPVFFSVQNRGVICTDLLAGTVYTGHTGLYSTESTALLKSR